MDEKEIAVQVGKKIKLLRTYADLNQIEFAEKIGASQTELSSWENGKRLPKTKYLYRICDLCNIGLNFFDRQQEVFSKE